MIVSQIIESGQKKLRKPVVADSIMPDYHIHYSDVLNGVDAFQSLFPDIEPYPESFLL